MALYTKIDKQIDNHCEFVSVTKSVSKRNFFLKIFVLIFLVFNVLMIIKCFI